MKILTSSQIRALDAYTIAHEPVSSWALMERASKAFVQWLLCKFDYDPVYHIFCGMGNNGGDGLAIARILTERGHAVKVYVVQHRNVGSADYELNLAKLKDHLTPVWIDSPADLVAPPDGVVIDALLGTGLSQPASGLIAAVIEVINSSARPVVSVDIASGLFAGDTKPGHGTDAPSEGIAPELDTIVRPDYTVSFQVPKPVFLIPECYPYVGEWAVVDIGLDAAGLEGMATDWYLTTRENLPHPLRKRGKYSHKGVFGHALLIAGSYGKMGAAVLASKACMRSGVGLLTSYIPACGYGIMQTVIPEAMVLTDPGDHFVTSVPDYAAYSAVGMGPGLGTEPETADALEKILSLFSGPMVLDADALNLLAMEPALLRLLPEGAVLTPHPKEFARLVGSSATGFEAIAKAQEFAAEHRVILCLKGAHTAVVLPDSAVFFNSTGNPGMATAGSGDVLTGMVLALLAQGYPAADAARLAVFRHGEAGDHAAARRSASALIASDIIENLRW